MTDPRYANPLPGTVEACEHMAELLRERGWYVYPPGSAVAAIEGAAESLRAAGELLDPSCGPSEQAPGIIERVEVAHEAYFEACVALVGGKFGDLMRKAMAHARHP